MKKNKNKLLHALIKCWNEIAISDKALIIIMFILLLQCIYNLFMPEPSTNNGISINVIVRTTVASIFGYFLSENFLKHEVIKSSDSNSPIIVTINEDELDDKDGKEKYLKDEDKNCKIESKNKSNNLSTDLKYYICNKSFQVIIALSVCVIALSSLIIGYDFNLIPEEANPSIIQFRDLISSCVGFLLGCSKNDSNKNSSKK